MKQYFHFFKLLFIFLTPKTYYTEVQPIKGFPGASNGKEPTY